MTSLYTILSSQFPEFVRANHTRIIQFLQTYYQWEEQQSIGKLEDVVNIDRTPDGFIQYFRQQLDKFGLFPSTSSFNRTYLKYIKQLYTSKGSEQALIFLLRVAFNQAAVDIRYPSENMLRASDGIWFQQSFITIERSEGTLRVGEVQNITDFRLFFDSTTQQVIQTTQIIVVEQTPSGEVTSLRLYFRRVPGITAVEGQPVEVRLQGAVVFRGRVVLSPSAVVVRRPGADWIEGQLVIIPGSSIPTIARVTRITTTGGIESIEVVQHGYNHTSPQTLVISPYRFKPAGTTFDVFDLLGEDGVTVIGTRLQLTDNLSSIEEYINGTQSNSGPNRYFAEDYSALVYNGSQVIDVAEQSVADSSQVVDSSVTLEQWIVSRAQLEIIYSPFVNTKGNWSTERGQVSNTNIRLQDNNYYQQFSYVIESNINPSQYNSIASSVHPAGTKRFDLYNLTTIAMTDPTAVISFPFRTLNAEADIINVTDGITSKQISRVLSTDQTTIVDPLLSKNLTKYMSGDSVQISDASQTTYEEFLFAEESYFAEEYTLNLKVLTLQQ